MLGLLDSFSELLKQGKDPQMALITCLNELSNNLEIGEFLEEASLLANRCLSLIPDSSYLVLNGKRYNFNFPFAHNLTHEQHTYALLEYECNKCGACEYVWNPRKADAPRLIKSVCCAGFLSHLFDVPAPDKFKSVRSYSSEVRPLSRVFIDSHTGEQTYYDFILAQLGSFPNAEMNLSNHYGFSLTFLKFYINEHGPKLGCIPKPIPVSTYLEIMEA